MAPIRRCASTLRLRSVGLSSSGLKKKSSSRFRISSNNTAASLKCPSSNNRFAFSQWRVVSRSIGKKTPSPTSLVWVGGWAPKRIRTLGPICNWAAAWRVVSRSRPRNVDPTAKATIAQSPIRSHLGDFHCIDGGSGWAAPMDVRAAKFSRDRQRGSSWVSPAISSGRTIPALLPPVLSCNRARTAIDFHAVS